MARPMTEDERMIAVERIRNLARGKLSDPEIGARLGITARTVRRLRERYAIPAGLAPTGPVRTALSPEQQATILPIVTELVAAGWSDKKIGETIGVGKYQVEGLRRKHKLVSVNAARAATLPAHIQIPELPPVTTGPGREPHCTECWEAVEKVNGVAANHGRIAADWLTRSGRNRMPVRRAVRCPGVGKPTVLRTEDEAAELAKVVSVPWGSPTPM